MRINHVYECATLRDELHGVRFEHVVAGEVVNAELNVAVIVHFLLLDVRRR